MSAYTSDHLYNSNLSYYSNKLCPLQIHIDFKDSFSNDYSVVLYDYLGQKVLESQILQPQSILNLECLSTGLYQLTIVNRQSITVDRRPIYKD